MAGMPLFPVIGQIQTEAKHVAVLGGLFPDAGSIPAASTNKETPTVLGWGFFSSVRASSRMLSGFLQKPADFASRPSGPFSPTFRSLLAILLSSLALLKWLEVRKDRHQPLYKSLDYARTNQAVDFQHQSP